MTIKAISPIILNGETFPTGDVIEVDDEAIANELIESGAATTVTKAQIVTAEKPLNAQASPEKGKNV